MLKLKEVLNMNYKSKLSVKEINNFKNNYKPAKRFTMIGNAILDDKRLIKSPVSYLILTQLIRRNNYHISNRLTCNAFGVSEKTFANHMNELIELGYVVRTKAKKGGFTYEIPTFEEVEMVASLVWNPRDFIDGKYSLLTLELMIKKNLIPSNYLSAVNEFIANTRAEREKAQKDIEEIANKDPNALF